MGLLDKFSVFAEQKKALMSVKPDIFGTHIDEIYSATEAGISGRRILLSGTNNYLGLTFAPECLAAAREAIDREGTGTTGSRMANGNYQGHRELEREFADFYRCCSAIVFSTGYQANLGTISALARTGDVLLIDSHCHASIYDGCQLSGADILRFRHNDPSDLEKRLGRLGERARSALVIVEGIYSMLGDRAPLEEIVKIKQEYGSYLLVDEAHSLGVLGHTGQGLVEEAGVLEQTDFITGTFSKSLGSIGGFCVSNHPQLDILRYMSRPYIFTASPSPANIASARAALRLLRQGTDLRRRLEEYSARLYGRLRQAGYRLGPHPGPIIASQLDTSEQALALWSGLLERGIYVNLVFPPASPDDRPLVRCSLSAAHTPEQVERIGDAFAELHDSVIKQN